MPVVGFLNGGSPGGYKVYVTGFLHGLSESGYVEGKNVTVDYQWARGQLIASKHWPLILCVVKWL